MNCVQKYCSPLMRNMVVERGLDMKLRTKIAMRALKMGAVNVVLLAILLFDISSKCPHVTSVWYVLEYAAAAILALGVGTCFLRYFIYLLFEDTIHGTKEQKNLLHFDDDDKSFLITPPKTKPQSSPAEEPVNVTMLSWQSSFNESRNSLSPNWSYGSSTPSPKRQAASQQWQLQIQHQIQQQIQQHQLQELQELQLQQQQQQLQLQNASWGSSIGNESAFNTSNLSCNSAFTSHKTCTSDEPIEDEQSLQKYLSEYSEHEEFLPEPIDFVQNTTVSTVNSFWNYCNTAANILKASVYQLAPITNPTFTKQSATDEGGLNIMNSNSEVIKRISSEKLSQYVTNLRVWISSTILERLFKEFESVDESFKNRGLIDMQIGNIGLERLKKTVENQKFIIQCMPRLPLLVPFLEMSSNQEYLVQRIKDLSKGPCISDYRWNSGSSYHGSKWDDHLSTDSSILFHLFCTYLDSQLMPLPQGGGRPFYSRYVIVGDEKHSSKDTVDAVQNRAHCAILCTNPSKPKFNFISDKKIHACSYDRNNLFYVIIQFLIYMKTHQDSCLEGVNLGRNGINIMCVIED